MITLRLDRRLQGRIDPSDILQEAFLTASLQLQDVLQAGMPFFLWLRLVTTNMIVSSRLLAGAGVAHALPRPRLSSLAHCTQHQSQVQFLR
jgi:RNA polymerase sigma-70 factor (ECF subfamily)